MTHLGTLDFRAAAGLCNHAASDGGGDSTVSWYLQQRRALALYPTYRYLINEQLCAFKPVLVVKLAASCVETMTARLV